MIRKHVAGTGRVTYGVRIHRGNGKYEWIGTFPTKRDAKEAEAKALVRSQARKPVTVEVLASRFLEEYERTRKRSSFKQAATCLREFRSRYGLRAISTITRDEAEAWAKEHNSRLPIAVTLFNYAVEREYIVRSPFQGLSRKQARGRADIDPLSPEDVQRLAQAALEAHGGYGPMLHNLVLFAAYTGLRAGELYALEWRDIDFDQGRVSVRRALAMGHIGLPKSNKPRPVALLPQARDALLGHPKTGDLIFTAKLGGRLSNSLMSGSYWPSVKVAYGSKVDFHELRHFCGHYLYVQRDLPSRVVATQLGHSSPRLVEELYGHFKSGALEELDRSFGNITELRAVQDARGVNA